MEKVLSAVLALLIFTGTLVSCGNDPGSNSGGNGSGGSQNETEYEFTRNYDGKTFRVLNYEDVFDMHAKISPETENGEVLNDTQFRCISTLEDRTGVTVEETNRTYEEYGANVRAMLSSGDDSFDIIYVNMNDMYPLASEGLLTNLAENKAISLGADWWLHENNDLCMPGGKLYSAEGYSQLMVIDATNIMMFNEDIAGELSLAMPYKTVSDGKWTLDVFAEYMKAGAAINLGPDMPDEENRWNYDQPGNAAALTGLIASAGEPFIGIVDGKLTLTGGSERFYNVCDKIAKIMSDNGSVMFYKERYGVSTQFSKARSLFAYGEISTTQQLREADFTFSVLPNPKYDESQSRYYSRKSWPSCGISIPVTAPDPEMAGALADALNYLSRDIVWPVYRRLVLEQKNLRNEESIEMLDIILNSGMPELATIYNVGKATMKSITAKLLEGDTDISSIIASEKSEIEAVVRKINEG